MEIFDNFKKPEFWVRVLQMALIFFVIFIGISLVLSHFNEIISGEFSTIFQEEWANGKWVNYFLIKFVVSFVYAIYMTSRMLNRRKRMNGIKNR